jgi:hypothetical protein
MEYHYPKRDLSIYIPPTDAGYSKYYIKPMTETTLLTKKAKEAAINKQITNISSKKEDHFDKSAPQDYITEIVNIPQYTLRPQMPVIVIAEPLPALSFP